MSENFIDATGINIQTYDQVVEEIVNGTPDIPGFKQIYGDDIIVDSNTPDGQMINIFALAKMDILQLAVMIYNSMDPDQAIGTSLDALCQLCGITRRGGSYTLVSIDITATSSSTLNGLDDPDEVTFTVSDNNGNQFQLLETVTLSVGVNSLNFQAVNLGNVQVLPDTITNPVTVIVGVTTINNPGAPYQQGEDQETDAQLRLRRQQSVALPAQGAFGSLLAAVLNLDGVVDAILFENATNEVDDNSIPAHSIWLIVDGGVEADIAEAIYLIRNLGVGMKGDTSYEIIQIDGSVFTVYFDRAEQEDLYVQFSVKSLSNSAIDEDALKDYLALNYIRTMNQAADITSISALVNVYSKDLVIYAAGVSLTASAYDEDVFPSSPKNKFVLDPDNIDIV